MEFIFIYLFPRIFFLIVVRFASMVWRTELKSLYVRLTLPDGRVSLNKKETFFLVNLMYKR